MYIAIASAEELVSCIAIRYEVFVIGQSVPLDLEVDGLDPTAVHFLARDAAGEPFGTARMRLLPSGIAKAERVAVLARARGTGAGTAIMRALEAEAERQGASAVSLNAQVDVIDFYTSLGYAAYGPVFDDAGIPHRAMKRALGAR